MERDTIAAVATGCSNSAISIVRMSGDGCIEVADRIFSSRAGFSLEKCASHTAHHGWIADGDEVIDEVIAVVMRAPRTYTGEDTVEINCHGGSYVTERVLETAVKYGARLAEPGEFTRRAFLNGKMDLSQAEAVGDLIASQNEGALRVSVRQLKGRLRDEIEDMREKILYEIAFIESALDDPEHISLDGYPERLGDVVKGLCGRLDRQIASFREGRIIKEGIRTVILGRPNAGKSSLLNLLLGEERAIVTDIEGTTRDTLEAQLNLHGILLNIVDTAGIRKTGDPVEQIGVERAMRSARDADLIIYVADSSREPDENDEEILSFIQDRQAVILLNKSDLSPVYTEDALKRRTEHPVIPFSARDGVGMDILEKALRDMFFQGKISPEEGMITSIRHKRELEEARLSLGRVQKSVEDGMPEEFYSIDLTDAYEHLGLIVGKSVGEDVVNEIFSKFCMGK